MIGFSGKGSKNPRFFCENCGIEVQRDAKNCPECGSCFASVRCLACDFTGEEILFKGGCPVCGYSSLKNPDEAPPFPENKKPAGPLPVWVYFITAAAFTATLAALFFKAFK